MQRPNSSVGPIRPRKLEYSSRDYSREHEAEAEEEAHDDGRDAKALVHSVQALPALRELGEEEPAASGSRHRRAPGFAQQRRVFEEARRKKRVRIYGNLARVAASSAYGGVGGSLNDFVRRGNIVQGHGEDEVPVGLFYNSRTERPDEGSYAERRASTNAVEGVS